MPSLMKVAGLFVVAGMMAACSKSPQSQDGPPRTNRESVKAHRGNHVTTSETRPDSALVGRPAARPGGRPVPAGSESKHPPVSPLGTQPTRMNGPAGRPGSARTDFLTLAGVALDRDLGPAQHQAQSITFLITLPKGAPLPPDRPYQKIRKLGEGRLRLTRSWPKLPKPRPWKSGRAGRATNLAQFLLPSAMLPCRAPLIEKLTRRALGTAQTDVDAAIRLTAFVNRYIIHKGYSLPAATALDVARLRRGDCTEHAVLLAAMARSAGIPARLLSGLVFAGRRPQGGYRLMYHMWTDLNLGGKWYPFDGTRPARGVDPTHILLAVDSGNDLLPVAATTVLSRVLGAMKVRVLSIQNRSHP